MASVHRDPRSPQGVWYCALTTADGRRVLRSTGKRNRREAMIICQMLQEAEDQASTGELTRASHGTRLARRLAGEQNPSKPGNPKMLQTGGQRISRVLGAATY